MRCPVSTAIMENMKKAPIKVLLIIIAIMGSYSIYGWGKIILLPGTLESYLQSMNANTILFTHKSLMINSIGTFIIQAIGILGAILALAKIKIGRNIVLAATRLNKVLDVVSIAIRRTLQARTKVG
jgi:hypothetical protein